MTDKRVDLISRSLRFLGFSRVNIAGLAGGIWLLWNDADIYCDIVSSIPEELHALIKVNSFSSHFYLRCVYAGPIFASRKLLWENLIIVSQSVTGPWVVLGDFNEVLSPNDRMGYMSFNNTSANLFQHCIDECNLMDLCFKRARFTWASNNNHGCIIRSRLDRCLANP